MNNKKKLIFLGLDVLVLIVTIGVSLAVFNYVKKGEESNQITINGITMKYVGTSNTISIGNAKPLTDEEGMILGLDEEDDCWKDGGQCYFDFTVSTKMNTSDPISYEVTAEKVESDNSLDNENVRLYLEKYKEEGENSAKEYEVVFSPKSYTPINSENLEGEDEVGAKNSEMLLDDGAITKSITYYYRLRMWVEGNYKITSETKTFSAKVNVYGKNVEVNSAKGIELDKSNITMQKGSSNKIVATIKDEDANNKNLIWESSDTSKVKVDSVGNITAIDIGTSVITVSTRDREYSATCTIMVVNYDAKGVTLNTNNVALSKGNTYQLTSIVTPTDASDTSVTYKSSSEGIATISNNGLITAVGTGETTITVETINGYTDTCKVIVTEPNVSEIRINGDDSVDVGNTIQLTTTITSDSVESSNVVWTTSDESKAIVSSTGKVTGIAPGTITITAYIKEYPDIKATKEIEVQYPEIKSITMSSDMTINYGNITTFSIWISPNQVRNQDKIRWISSNTSVATIPSTCNGNLSCSPKIISDGTTTIKAVVVDSEGLETSILDTATLTVKINTINLTSYIESLYKKAGSKTASTVTSTDTLFSDSTADNNIRYTGSSPNNYVWFNNERWRIIGAMNNIYSSGNTSTGKGTGIAETRIKIISSESIGKYAMNTNNINNWPNATLNNQLNSNFENQLVEKTYWNLGATSRNILMNSTDIIDFYSNVERGDTHGSGMDDLGWIGFIGLIYPSDYAFAGYSCGKGKTLYSVNLNDSYSFCKSDNWLSHDVWQWTITPDYGYSKYGVYIRIDGRIYDDWDVNSDSMDIYPSLYLKSNVVVKQDGADGSYDHPYNIALGS